jgi:hypothetical protein
MMNTMYKPTRVPSPITISRGMKSLPNLTPEKILACELICTKRGKYPSYDDIAAQVGISARTLHRWRLHDADFHDYIRQRSLIECNLALPQVIASVTERAIGGSSKHSELIFKVLNMLVQNHEVTVTPVDRSTESINLEIQELTERLGLNVENYKNEGE